MQKILKKTKVTIDYLKKAYEFENFVKFTMHKLK